MKINVDLVDKAAINLEKVATKTPLVYSKRLSKLYKAKIYLKREDLQDVRSFKIRGAFNKMSSLSVRERKRGVVTASAGNHAQGVAYSCAYLKIKGVIFMPVTTPNQKIDRVKHFGEKYIEVKLVGNTFDDAYKASLKYCADKKVAYVHPFNDPQTIIGQATVGKEIWDQTKGEVDIVLAAVGGGGLVSGISSYLKEKDKKIQIYGVEPNGAAAMHHSLIKKKVITLDKIDHFVDGAAVKAVGDLTFEICKKLLSGLITVEEGKVCTTMIELYQNEGIVAEPAGALGITALDSIADKIKGKRVVCILSGGNNDILRYPEVMEKSLVYLGKKHYFIVEFTQKPGQLKNLVNEVLGSRDDIVRFEYIKKTNKERGAALVGIELADKKDFEPLIKKMKLFNINYTHLTKEDLLYHYLI